MGYLSGGQKDVDPPVVLSSKPKNYSTNFKSQKIEIVFNEYIALKNISQELIISPPLPKKPDVRIKNKSLVIDLKNVLRDSTTYTLNFGKAIADNNEGNALTNYEFVFSTGNFLDSLSVNGTMVSAFNLTPSKEPMIVGLYDILEDSVPLKSIPVYVGKTDDKGLFMINNIKADTFRLFALKDLNFNLLYDLPTEEIAFVDTVIYLTPDFLRSMPIRTPSADSTFNDSLKLKKQENKSLDTEERIADQSGNKIAKSDSIKTKSVKDSLIRKPGLPPIYVDMYYFLQEGTRRYMTGKERPGSESFQLSFSLPLEADPPVRVLNFSGEGKWYLPEINARRDTFTYWITDTTLIKTDSLFLEVTYPKTDSMGNDLPQTDTVKFITRKPVTKAGKGKQELKATANKFTVNTIRNGGSLDLNTNLSYRFNFPVQKIDTSLLHLFMKEDTLEVLQKFKILQDSAGLRKIYVQSNWKEKSKYKIVALPGAFVDIYNHINDTLQTSFSVQQKSFYGTLTVSLSNVNSPVLVQLMNEREVVLQAKPAKADGKLVFEYLPAAKYKLKFVFDKNENKKWDTGNYLKKTQPEKVRYYKGEINVRSNWEMEIKQDIERL